MDTLPHLSEKKKKEIDDVLKYTFMQRSRFLCLLMMDKMSRYLFFHFVLENFAFYLADVSISKILRERGLKCDLQHDRVGFSEAADLQQVSEWESLT